MLVYNYNTRTVPYTFANVERFLAPRTFVDLSTEEAAVVLKLPGIGVFETTALPAPPPGPITIMWGQAKL